MIENLKTNKDMLNFLMTSEFLEDELNPSDLRLLLLKFRWFYRSSHSKQISMESKIQMLEDKVESLEKDKEILSKEVGSKDTKYKEVVNRDLTFKERVNGKIYENKNKRKFKFFKK